MIRVRAGCRISFMGSVALVGAIWVSACGDGATEPAPSPPPSEPPRATTMTVTPATAELTALGATVQLSARVLDQNGQAMTGAAVAWSTGDAAVATVGTSGLVTAISNGAATITATSGTASAGAQIAVAQAVSAVRVSPGSLALLPGDTARLEATALDSRDNKVPDIAFEWSSSDAGVATVDSSGLVLAVRVGSATVAAASGDWRDSSRITVPTDDPSDHHAALTAGLPERPFVGATVGGTVGSTKTVGTLRMGLNPDVFPVIAGKDDVGTAVLVAGSRLGDGRVVAFSGQDFISSGDRATLLGTASADHLLANAVRWAGARGAAPVRVLVDNERIADALEAQGIDGVEVVGRQGSYVRDWSDDELSDVDVAVVQANEWGRPHLVGESVPSLRSFAERGGGLVVAASALHWNWWIEQRHGPLAANLLLRDAGISWSEDSIDEIESATTSFDPRLIPTVVWSEYIGGGRLDAGQMALLGGLFGTAVELGLTDELDSALVRLVRETPALPTPSSAPEARLAADVGEMLDPYEWPEPHPWAAVFPGLPADGAQRIDGTVTVDATWSEFPADASRRERHIPLQFYAPPSALVTIEVPAGHATGDLQVSVGELHDHLGQAGHPVWERAPGLRRTFPVTDRHTEVTNAYGGSLALIVPADYSGMIPVTVRGAIPMAVFTADESNAAEWRAELDAGAPQAIIQRPGGIRLVISAESARGVSEPGEVSAFWDGFQRHHAELAGEPVPRAYESIWIFDPQVGYGYANASWLRINYPLEAEPWVLFPATSPGWWLFGHELGHQWQTRDWRGNGITEVAVNLFTMYTLNYYIFGGGDHDVGGHPRAPGTVDHAALANLRWPTADVFDRLSLYRQLIVEFGWDAMKRVFHSYYDPAYPRSTYGGELDGFAIRFSAVVQRDLVRFFRHWEYPLSDSAAATIGGFGHEEWLPPGW